MLLFEMPYTTLHSSGAQQQAAGLATDLSRCLDSVPGSPAPHSSSQQQFSSNPVPRSSQQQFSSNPVPRSSSAAALPGGHSRKETRNMVE